MNDKQREEAISMLAKTYLVVLNYPDDEFMHVYTVDVGQFILRGIEDEDERRRIINEAEDEMQARLASGGERGRHGTDDFFPENHAHPL